MIWTRVESVIHIDWISIWQSCIVRMIGLRYPSEEMISTKEWTSLSTIGKI